ncbi:hypothetical protein GPSY_0167 [Paraglaciecola psychrophila 170]|nr:hypothetical protein GPSY_0167 [Paraglaciecola psychrophila 170]
MAGDPTKQTYKRRIILLYFAAKTLQHQLPLSVGHVRRLCKNYFQPIILTKIDVNMCLTLKSDQVS